MEAAADRLRRVANRPTLVLTHYGRKSGKPYRVVIWFLADSGRFYLATADVRRNWVKNVTVNPNVLLRIGDETFRGTVRRITSQEELDRVFGLVQAKYWYALPFIWAGRILQMLGLLPDRTGAFEVILSDPANTFTGSKLSS